MTIRDLLCDVCGRAVPGPGGAGVPAGAGGVRFAYHPGNLRLRDDSGLVCERCWAECWRDTNPVRKQCAVCGQAVAHEGSLHIRRLDEPQTWQLCRSHAVRFLNRLRTVDPKLDPATFQFPMS
jgi:hypothetical protein